MVPGCEGSLVSESVLEVEFPQPLLATTANVPVVKLEATLMLILVPVFEIIVQLAGGVQTYPVAPVTAARHIIQLNGADFVTINNLNIVSTAIDFGWGVHLTNAANNNRITNCTINISANTSTTQSNSAGIVATGSGTSVTTQGDNASNTIITGNSISGAYQGIIMYGILATPTVGNNISTNTIRDFYATGIDLAYQSGATVAGNNIQRATRTVVTTFTGIQLSVGTVATLVNANRIHDTHNAAVMRNSPG
jgi:parallel beta-helix repeat protein